MSFKVKTKSEKFRDKNWTLTFSGVYAFCSETCMPPVHTQSINVCQHLLRGPHTTFLKHECPKRWRVCSWTILDIGYQRSSRPGSKPWWQQQCCCRWQLLHCQRSQCTQSFLRRRQLVSMECVVEHLKRVVPASLLASWHHGLQCISIQCNKKSTSATAFTVPYVVFACCTIVTYCNYKTKWLLLWCLQ